MLYFVRLDVDLNNPEAFAKLDSPQMASAIINDLKYFTKHGGKNKPLPFSMQIELYCQEFVVVVLQFFLLIL